MPDINAGSSAIQPNDLGGDLHRWCRHALMFSRARTSSILELALIFPQNVENENVENEDCNSGLRVAIVLPTHTTSRKLELCSRTRTS